jgi:hypothetical protein
VLLSRRPARALATVAVVAALLAACSNADWSRPRPGPTAQGALGVGFMDPSAPPAPEATISPSPGSWDGVAPAPGYRVVLLTAGDDEPTRALVTAVTDWAREQDVDLRTVRATEPHELVGRISEAVEMNADLVISAGNDLVDPLTLVSASHLDQQILVVGAELAEPTHNVTAVDWSGASFRGEGLGTSSTYDAGSFTPDRCALAVRAGVAAVLSGLTGIVVWVD